jgi:hypothetical protein
MKTVQETFVIGTRVLDYWCSQKFGGRRGTVIRVNLDTDCCDVRWDDKKTEYNISIRARLRLI